MKNQGNLIPHKYPFILIDEVISFEGKSGTALKKITSNEKYSLGVTFSPVYYIEIMAQAVALINGLQAKENGKKIKHGYLIACRGLQADKLPSIGDTLIIKANEITKLENTYMYTCECYVDDKLYAKAKLSFYVEMHRL
jgi:predicted hotdog family 3-hydroxylacyl-ACP dehydratase